MVKLKLEIIKIKEIAPKAWIDLDRFYQANFPNYANDPKLSLESMPFEFLIGILLLYFNENGIDWDLSNIELGLLPDSLVEIFENYEKVISHYS